jgi:hypothetical protein
LLALLKGHLSFGCGPVIITMLQGLGRKCWINVWRCVKHQMLGNRKDKMLKLIFFLCPKLKMKFVVHGVIDLEVSL